MVVEAVVVNLVVIETVVVGGTKVVDIVTTTTLSLVSEFSFAGVCIEFLLGKCSNLLPGEFDFLAGKPLSRLGVSGLWGLLPLCVGAAVVTLVLRGLLRVVDVVLIVVLLVVEGVVDVVVGVVAVVVVVGVVEVVVEGVVDVVVVDMVVVGIGVVDVEVSAESVNWVFSHSMKSQILGTGSC